MARSTWLIQLAPVSTEVSTDRWLVTHHQERHTLAVRTIGDHLAALMRTNAALFRGERPLYSADYAARR